MSDSTKAIIATFVKTFIVAMLAQFIALGTSVFDITKDGWKSVVSSGVAAVVMFAYNYFSTSFPLYGNSKAQVEPPVPPTGA